MKTASLVAIVYGAFLALGGIQGYVAKNSYASLISGVACGAILIGCGLAMKRGMQAAWWAAALVTVAVAGRFAPVFFKTNDWWPAGITALVSVVALVGLVVGLMSARKTD